MAEFFEQWDVPSKAQIKEFLQQFPDDIKGVDVDKVLDLSAMYSQTIMGEDPVLSLDHGYSEENLELFNRLPLTGNPIERGAKLGHIMYRISEEEMNQMKKNHSAGILEEYMKTMADECESKMSNTKGRGGPSHNSDWFAGMQIESPIRMTNKERQKVLDAVKELKKHSSFNLSSKSKKLQQDDWGEQERNVFGGLPDDIMTVDREDLVLDELFDYKFMMSQISYWENYSPIQERKEWLVIIDDSGSMNNPQKLQWVLALLEIIAEDVIRNGSIAYIGMYEENLSPYWKIDSKESIAAFIKMYRGGRGGGTDIENALNSTAVQLAAGGLICQGDVPYTSQTIPVKNTNMEMFVVCDGNDNVSDDFVPPIKTHSLSLYELNLTINNAVKRTMGTTFNVDEQGLHQT